MKKNDILETPKWVIDELGFFDLDPCAGNNTKIGKVNYNIFNGDDGLKLPWFGIVYCNPPFSQKELWIEKMINHSNGILILPERGSAPWFGPLAKKCGCYFIMGKKIDFVGGSSSNNIGSVLFPFGNESIDKINQSKLPGHFVKVEYFRPRNIIKTK